MEQADLAINYGNLVYVLRAAETSAGLDGYSYRIYPSELKIKEIRTGVAPWLKPEVCNDYYPRDIYLLCQNKCGKIELFYSIGGKLLSSNSIAGRNTRAFFNKSGLLSESVILRDYMLKIYKNVKNVEISFPKGFFGGDEQMVNTVISDVKSICENVNKESI